MFGKISQNCEIINGTNGQFLLYLRNFQYHGSKLYCTAVAPNYPETNSRFQNNNFRVLLIMQFHKLLISISRYKIVALRCGAQCRTDPADIQKYTEKSESDKYLKRQFSKVSTSILNSVLHVTELHYFNMNRKETKLKGLSEIRFGSMIFLFRIAGIPFHMKKISTIYAIYMRTVIICASTTYLGLFGDVYMHWDDLGRAMTALRALIPFTNIMWIFSYCR